MTRMPFLRAALLILTLLVTSARAQPDNPVSVTFKASKAKVAPGDTVAVAVVFDCSNNYHIHTNKPMPPPGIEASSLFPTEITVKPNPGIALLQIQWPKTTNVSVDLSGKGKPTPYAVFGGHAVAYVPIRIDAGAKPGDEITLEFTASYQACDDKSCLPSEDVSEEVKLQVVAGPSPAAAVDPDFANFDPVAASRGPVTGPTVSSSGATNTTSANSSAPKFDFFFVRFSLNSIALILLVAAVGGFILNLTPCVLPVVPLKVMALQSSAGHNSARRILLGVSMSLGVTAFWLGLGILIISLKVFRATNELFGNPYFLLIVGGFIGVMALGMLGAFTIQLPQKLYLLNPSHDSLHGSFGFGVMTAILGTPCFGPFAGAAAGWATTQAPAVGLAAFTAVGVGMAFPYLVLAIWPNLLGFIPRTGPASELVKQVMGLLLFAAGVFFLGTGILSLVAEKPYMSSVLHWWAAALFCAVAGLWMTYRTIRITSSTGKRLTFSLIGLLIAAIGIGWAQWQTTIARETYVPPLARNDGLWKDYTPEAFDEAIKSGRVVAIDFTADWCINCKVMEATVLNRDQVKGALGAPGITAFRADLTSRKALGWTKLADLHEVGIPLLAIFGPGLSEPWKSNAYSPTEVATTLDQAKGQAAAVSATESNDPRSR